MSAIEILTRVELAFGADLAQSPSSWAWTDITKRQVAGSRTTVYQQPFSLPRGRSDEAGQTQPAGVGFTVHNHDGALTPDNPSSIWWPNVGRGTPCRISLRAGTPLLVIPGEAGDRARAADHADLHITGDLWVAVDGARSAFHPSTPGYQIAGRYELAGDNRSWLLWTTADNAPRLLWSTDGTAGGVVHAVGTVPIPQLPGGRLALGAHLDVDDGGGNHVVTFKVAATRAGPWTEFDQVIAAGTTSVHAGTAPLDLGDVADTGLPFVAPARYYGMEVRSGDETGTLVADVDFTGHESATAFVDDAGRSWSLDGGTEITSWRPRFLGQVDEIRPRWPTQNLPGNAEVDIHASGTLHRLAQGAKPLDSAMRRRVLDVELAPSITAYWPIEDGRDSTVAASPLPGVSVMTVGGAAAFAGDSAIDASLPVLAVPGGQPAGWHATVPPPAGATTMWAVEMIVRIPTAPAGAPLFPVAVIDTTSDLGSEWILGVNSTSIQLFIGDGSGGGGVAASGPPTGFFDAKGTLVRIEAVESGANVVASVEWTPLSTPEVTTGILSPSTAGTAGRVAAIRDLFAAAPPDGFSIGHLIVQSGLLSGWLSDAVTAYAGEPAGTRFTRLCAEEGTPARIYGAPADSEPMGPQRAVTLPQLLQECADAELGIIGEARDVLGLTFRTRASLHNQPPAMTFDYAAGHVPDLRPSSDDQRLRNDITVARDDGSSARVIDDESVATGGRYDESVRLNVAADGQLIQQAAWRLHLGTWPQMRYPTIAPELEFHQALLADDWLELVEGDLVAVTNLPPEHPPGSVEELVEGSTEAWDQHEWRPMLNCSPAGPWTVGVLDTDGTPDTDLARLDTDGSSLDVGIDSTDLVWDVDITAGPLWTTAAAQFPLDVIIDGELITLSGISGASSPQTFTASARAVNGVVKSHAAGTPVRVATPFRLAL